MQEKPERRQKQEACRVQTMSTTATGAMSDALKVREFTVGAGQRAPDFPGEFPPPRACVVLPWIEPQVLVSPH